MSKQTYTSKIFKRWTDEQVLSSLLIPYFDQCEKCNDEKWCEPDDYRVEDGSFCSVPHCPLLIIMQKDMVEYDELYLKLRDNDKIN